MEARLLERGAVAFRKSAFEIEEVLPPFPSKEAGEVVEQPPNEPVQDDGQNGGQNSGAGQQQEAAQQAPPKIDDPFALLGQALDEIEQEQRAEAKEHMAPTRDVVEITPGPEARYRRMTGTFICSDRPPPYVTPHVERKGGLIATMDKDLESLLSLSLERARSAFEQKRVCDVGRLTRRAR